MERRFRIEVQGRLDERFGEAFGPVTVEALGDHTLLTGRSVDQAYLDGVLAYLRCLGLELISIQTDTRGKQGGGAASETAKEIET